MLAQTLVFTGHGVGLAGLVFHLCDLLLQRFVFRGQGLVAEHVAVVLLRLLGQGVGGALDGRHDRLDDHIRQTLSAGGA